MAIRVIRICDECKKEYKQIIDKQIIDTINREITYKIDFLCSDCVLIKAKQEGKLI